MTNYNSAELPSLPTYLKLGQNFGFKLLLRHPDALEHPTAEPRYLFLRRSAAFRGVFFGAMPYDLPGGLVDLDQGGPEGSSGNESLVEGAGREATEELEVKVDVDTDKTGNPVILDQVNIPLEFQEGHVDLTRAIGTGQAHSSDITYSWEHTPDSALWLPLREAFTLNFDKNTRAAFARIAGGLATGRVILPSHLSQTA